MGKLRGKKAWRGIDASGVEDAHANAAARAASGANVGALPDDALFFVDASARPGALRGRFREGRARGGGEGRRGGEEDACACVVCVCAGARRRVWACVCGACVGGGVCWRGAWRAARRRRARAAAVTAAARAQRNGAPPPPLPAAAARRRRRAAPLPRPHPRLPTIHAHARTHATPSRTRAAARPPALTRAPVCAFTSIRLRRRLSVFPSRAQCRCG
jgi:hypothetical protein